jgi:RimJ/RimL family protein N-acetyltransferase
LAHWVARLKSTGDVVGHFQAGVKEGPDSNLGYTVGRKFQRHGFASEALRGILSLLGSEIGIKSIKAWIDTRNIPSILLVEKLGMVRIDFIKRADNFKGADSDEFVYQFTYDQ